MRLAGAPASGGELDDSTQSPPHAALLSAAAER
ncbi:tRNA adenosine(34) deaminase TadA, partial [Burkholderia pseudomallei]